MPRNPLLLGMAGATPVGTPCMAPTSRRQEQQPGRLRPHGGHRAPWIKFRWLQDGPVPVGGVGVSVSRDLVRASTQLHPVA